MTMRTHTPGPWNMKKTDRPGMEPRYDVLHGIHYVADPMTSSAYRDGAETLANAHLIAAAPDLLAALEHLLSVYVECVEPTCPFGEAATAEQAARAALAKAKGG
jgi:hypothetical protein